MNHRRPTAPTRSAAVDRAARSAVVESLEGRRLLSASPITITAFDVLPATANEGDRVPFRLTADGPAGSHFTLTTKDETGLAESSHLDFAFDASGHFDSAVYAAQNRLPASFNASRFTHVVADDANGLQNIVAKLQVLNWSSYSYSINYAYDPAVAQDALTVQNVAPVLSSVRIGPDDGSLAFGQIDQFRIFDAGRETDMRLTVDWGDGRVGNYPLKITGIARGFDVDGTPTDGFYYGPQYGEVAHSYDYDGTYPVLLTVSDGEAEVTRQGQIITAGVEPSFFSGGVAVDFGATQTSDDYGDYYVVDEGTVGTVTQPWKVGDLNSGLTASLDWGDGAAVESQHLAPEQFAVGTAGYTFATFTFSHRYLDETPEPADEDVSDYYEDVGLALSSAAAHDSGAASYGGLQPNGPVILVRNVAPTVRLTPAAAEATPGQRFDLAALVTDPGVLDSQSVVVDWGDGTSETYDLPADGTLLKDLPLSHVYADETPQDAPRVVSVTATDNDGGTSTTTASVSVVLPPPPPAAPVTVAFDGATGTLALTGTEENDTVLLRDAGNGRVGVTGNGVDLGDFAAKLVVVDVKGGDDDVDGSAVNVSLVVRGGEGNDSLVGGSGSDLLAGDAGNDIVRGGLGLWDVLSGGDGDDLLTDPDGVFSAIGGTGNDVIDLQVLQELGRPARPVADPQRVPRLAGPHPGQRRRRRDPRQRRCGQPGDLLRHPRRRPGRPDRRRGHRGPAEQLPQRQRRRPRPAVRHLAGLHPRLRPHLRQPRRRRHRLGPHLRHLRQRRRRQRRRRRPHRRTAQRLPAVNLSHPRWPRTKRIVTIGKSSRSWRFVPFVAARFASVLRRAAGPIWLPPP